jgi:hypothetical protein
MGLFESFKTWWSKPFNIEGDAISWFFFVGLILILIFLWSRVLKEGGHLVNTVA